MGKIKALVFDMDGLLIDSERVVKRTWKEVGELLGYERVEEHIYEMLGATAAKRDMYFAKTFGSDFPMNKFTSLTSKRFYEIIENEGLGCKPGAVELMEAAREKGLKIGLATSSRQEYAEKMLTKVGLWSYIDGAAFGNMVTKAKPDPEIFLLACALLGVEPEEVIVFEDSPAGVRAGHAGNMKVVMVPDLAPSTDELEKLYYKKVETLFEAIPLLDELC